MNNRQKTDVTSYSYLSECDLLRDEKSAQLPDARSEGFSVIDSGWVRTASLKHH